MACAACGAGARKLVAAPYLADMKPAVRMAHARNEKSAHEPRVARAGDPALAGMHAGHHHGHHHHGPSKDGAVQWVRSPHASLIGH